MRLRALAGLSVLCDINLKGCYKVADAGVAALAHLTTLCALNLQECWQITASGLAYLSGVFDGGEQAGGRGGGRGEQGLS